MTRRKQKRLNAGFRGKGEKTRPGTRFVTGCPFCEWVTIQGYKGPLQVSVGPSTKIASCRNNHKWLVV